MGFAEHPDDCLLEHLECVDSAEIRSHDLSPLRTNKGDAFIKGRKGINTLCLRIIDFFSINITFKSPAFVNDIGLKV